ncbi:ABC transporter permease [Ilumatobacter coccineus]|uniref:Putative ABC transporter permease protein n=1 Tax=Ilumatobacter coccineus (strain NBRC 103263 / KCTC 29153 / YM16-304) TaxID=1313172 RepID=A0A6C7E583_ILUCY|nr:ABC transporter permease subunit [Ilumatobacter coccineus]BAN01720.1 putative ABC transporter permease protein [Ilumatobacter coccineus YM16-304]
MSRHDGLAQALRRALLFVVALGLAVAAWEFYKWIGPAQGGDVFGWRIIPKTNDRVMPHTWEMVSELFDPAIGSRDQKVWQVLLGYAWYTFQMSIAGLAVGAAIGIGLAVLMARFRVVERGLLPYVVISQTIPLIALAPQVTAIRGSLDWPQWTSAVALAAFLSFFPVTVATLRGLQAAPAASLELMDSYAAGWWTTLRKLRFPVAVPYMVPGMKLAATAAVIGVIVTEITLGGLRGVGFATIDYSQKVTAQPASVYAAVFAAAALGLVMFGLVVASESLVMRKRPKEAI